MWVIGWFKVSTKITLGVSFSQSYYFAKKINEFSQLFRDCDACHLLRCFPAVVFNVNFLLVCSILIFVSNIMFAFHVIKNLSQSFWFIILKSTNHLLCVCANVLQWKTFLFLWLLLHEMVYLFLIFRVVPIKMSFTI